MLAMACLVTKTMACHDEPTKLHTHPPRTAHFRTYVTGRSAYPPGTQTPTPEGEEVSWSPSSDPHLRGVPHSNSIWTLAMPN